MLSLLAAAIQGDAIESARLSDDGADRDDENVDQLVGDLALAARIFKRHEMRDQGLEHGSASSHQEGKARHQIKSPPRALSCVCPEGESSSVLWRDPVTES